jgi:glutamine amidotransferase
MGLIEVLCKKVIVEKTPILGICLGMQLFTKKSEEGNAEGLGWIDAQTVKFQYEENKLIKIPHIGWNSVILQKDCPIFYEVDTKELFYFVHSYHVKCKDAANVISKTEYGVTFVSSVQKDNILGVQFHPEKSHKNGLKILKNFSDRV